MSYSAEVLADSPLAYYRLGEASGTTMVDSSGNGHDGVYGNAPTLGATGLLTGDPDTCVDFDGSNDYGDVPDAAWMRVGNITVEAVIGPDVLSGTRSIADRDSSATRVFQFRTNGSVLELIFWTTTSGALFIMGATPLSVGDHVAFTYDGVTAKIFVNGAVDGSQVPTPGPLQTNAGAPLAIGASRGGGTTGAPAFGFFDGRIDEVAYYGTALSEARIAAHAAAVTSGGGAIDEISLAGVLPAIQSSLTPRVRVGTTLANRINGRRREGIAYVTDITPVAPVPAGVSLGTKVDKALAYPTPTLVDGRPT